MDEVDALLAELAPDLSPRQVGRASTCSPEIRVGRVWRPLEEPGYTDLLPLPGSEWTHERRKQDVILGQLPPRLQKLVRKVRNTHYRGTVLDAIGDAVRRLAAEDDRILSFEGAAYEPSLDLHRLRPVLARDPQFTSKLFRLAKRQVAQGAYSRTWLTSTHSFELPRILDLPPGSSGSFRSWTGLTLKPLRHRPPEGLLLALAQRFWIRVGPTPESTRLVLDWGAGNSPFARALVATNPKVVRPEQDEMTWDEVASAEDAKKVLGERRWYLERRTHAPRVQMDEVELMGEPSDVPIIRFRDSVPRSHHYDQVLIQLPPPCEGRGGYRDRHKDRIETEARQVRLADLGRLGPQRWKASVRRLLPGLLGRLREGGEIAILIPQFRVGSREAFTPAAMVEGLVVSSGLSVERTIRIEQDEASEGWVCILASRKPCSPSADPEIDRFLNEAAL